MKKSTMWAWCLVALLAAIGYSVLSRPGVVVVLVMLGLPLVLALLVGMVGE